MASDPFPIRGGDGLGPRWQLWRRRRFVLASLAFWGLVSMYTTRINFSVAIVAMTSGSGACHRAALPANASAAANASTQAGLLQGVVFPCLNAIWARWAPPLERSRLATTVASGCNVGTVIVLPLSGLLAAHVGWPSIFYVFGAGGVLWWALWWAQTADSPERDRRVSDKERRFIEDALGVDTATAKVSFHPWRRFFTSPAYLGKLVAHFCANWGFYTLVTQMPMYLKDTLGFDLRAAGFVSALPYVVMALLLQVAGHTADWLERRQLLNTTHAGCLLLSTALLDPTAVVACLTLGVALEAFAYAVICFPNVEVSFRFSKCCSKHLKY
ncbi:Putative inorganic phosphate cotransporter [Gryllus bimaculatus]|nr:Putative inorganic phosphate cotransporter [Gryllus bimaculatus]